MAKKTKNNNLQLKEETHSAEMEVTMEEKKEQLEKEEIVEAQDILVEKLEDGVTIIENPDESSDEEEGDVPKESLSKESVKIANDIKVTKEELSVIKEVRDELVTLYSKSNQLQKNVEQLSAENVKLKDDNSLIIEQLNKFIEAEKQLKERQKLERLTALSVKFKLLGQDKSVEQLSTKDDETVSEFEKIVDAALRKSGESMAMPSVTVPSQATEQLSAKSKDVPKVEVKKQKEPEKLNSKEKFFSHLLDTMAKEQLGYDRKPITL